MASCSLSSITVQQPSQVASGIVSVFLFALLEDLALALMLLWLSHMTIIWQPKYMVGSRGGDSGVATPLMVKITV